MPDRHLVDATVGETPTHEELQQLLEAETGRGTQGVLRTWQASDSDRVVLTSDASGVRISRDNGTTAPTNVINDGTAAGGALAGTYPSPTLAAATIDALVPPGTIWAHGGAEPPSGWLRCNGAAVSRTEFAKLFAAIGTLYGSGDGSTTFTVPNFEGRVILGASGTHPLGTVGGSETPAHTHPGSHSHGVAHTHTQAHTHLMNHDHLSDHPTATSTVAPASPSAQAQPTGAGLTAVGLTHWHTFDVPPSISQTTGDPSPTSSGASSNGTSATDTTAHGAAWTAAGALPPFGTASYIIRAGA